MTPIRTRLRHRLARVRTVLTTAVVCALVAAAAPAAASPSPGVTAVTAVPASVTVPVSSQRRAVAMAAKDLAAKGWVWPAERFGLVRPFVAPAHRYGPGHRGIDLAPAAGSALRAPADGVVAFSGSVAGRGILTIDHGDGLVTTLEPVQSVLTAGTPVRRGEDVASLAVGGHAAPGTVHFGVRSDGEYINPMLLLGGVPRAVLLPCCR